RSRLVVMRSDLVAELRSYVAQRQRLVRDLGRPDPEAFFLRRDASGLTVRSASEAIRRLLRQLASSLPQAVPVRVLTSFATIPGSGLSRIVVGEALFSMIRERNTRHSPDDAALRDAGLYADPTKPFLQ